VSETLDRAPSRPEYKNHPLWNEAMAVTQAAYALAEVVRPADPMVARHLRKAAVAIPAHVAGALNSEGEARRDHVLTARGALSEVSRQAARAETAGGTEAATALARRASALDRAVHFELAEPPGGVS
jgi:23S rRNA-intervening sequence protein